VLGRIENGEEMRKREGKDGERNGKQYTVCGNLLI
jgi:hypothetical protein